jgi:hypothetical protein
MDEFPRELGKLPKEYQVFTPACGHVSYICASRVVPKTLVASGWPPGIQIQRIVSTRPTWIISGRDKTSADGRATIDLDEYLVVPECAPVGYQDHWGPAIIDGRPSFFVNHHSENPAVLGTNIVTTAHEEGEWLYRDLLDGHFYPSGLVEYKIKATVRAWNLDREPLALDFSWLCIAEGAMRWHAI